MAVAPISDVLLLPPLRGAGAIPAFVPPMAGASPASLFSNVVSTAIATSGPLPASLGGAVSGFNGTSLLERSYFRDLVAGFGAVSGAGSPVVRTPAYIGDLGIDALLGRSGLPATLNAISERQAVALYGALVQMFTAIQALGSEDEGAEPSLGALLDITV